MKLCPRLIIPFALLGLTAGPACAQAGPSVSNSFFHGNIAEAGFGGGGLGCIASESGVIASDGNSFDPATGRRRGSTVHVHVGSVDRCTGRTLHEISADADLAAGEFSVDSGLGTAALQTSFMALDQATGQLVSLDLRLTWTATSTAGMARSIWMKRQLDGTWEITRSDGQERDALASGTVSVDGSALFAGNATFADLQSVRDGSHTQSSR